MNRARPVACLALLLAFGCSGSDKNDAPLAVANTQDAASDVELTKDVGTSTESSVVPVDLDACVRARVWTASSTGFTLHEDAGPPSEPGGDAGCSEGGVTFVFSSAAKTLIERQCRGSAVVETTLMVTAIPADLLALLMPLQTSCSPGCGTDLPDIHLVVHDGATAKRTFDSSAYAECADSSATNPLIRFADLRSIRLKLGALLASCDSDGGGVVPEGGMCVQGAGDGGK